MSERDGRVGPVLQAGEVADAVLAAIRRLNDDVLVEDRGSYVRVLVPGRCRVTRQSIEEGCGAPFRLPTDLEAVMTSFKGAFRVTDEEAVWELRARPEEATR